MSTNLSIYQLTESQSSKYLTSNNADAQLLNLISGEHTHNIATDADYTLTLDEELYSRRLVITDTGVVLTAGRNIVVPNTNREIQISNQTAQILTVKTSSGTGIAVGAGKTTILYCDATNVVRVTADV
jgi:hypothetical protein